MNGKELGFQKELDLVKGPRDVPGWFGDLKADFIIARIAHTYEAIRPGDRHFQIVDMGSWKGKSASVMASTLPNKPLFVWCIDHWLGSPGEQETNHVQAAINPLSVLWEFYQYTSHLGLLGKRMGAVTMPSEQAAEYFEDGGIDFIFLDGDHDDVYADLNRWVPKLRRKAMLVGDDYDWPTVKRDFDRFMDENQSGYHYATHAVSEKSWFYSITRN
jgi:hypothetical protein